MISRLNVPTPDNKYFSEKFIYFNDDIAFTKPICLKDFWNQEKGFQVYLQGSRGQPRNFVCPGTLAVWVRLRLGGYRLELFEFEFREMYFGQNG